MIDTVIFQIGNVLLLEVLLVSYRGLKGKKKEEKHKAILTMQSCRVVQM